MITSYKETTEALFLHIGPSKYLNFLQIVWNYLELAFVGNYLISSDFLSVKNFDRRWMIKLPIIVILTK